MSKQEITGKKSENKPLDRDNNENKVDLSSETHIDKTSNPQRISWEKLVNWTNIWTAIIAAFFGIGGAILGGYLTAFVWIDTKVDAKVQQNIEPYELYLGGVNLIRDEYYDRAIPDLEKSFDTLVKKETPKNRVIPVADSFLTAIVNSDNPGNYTSQFKKVKDYLDKEASTDPWYFNEYGWYYFRMNNLSDSRNSFNQAITFYKTNNSYRQIGRSQWGLALVNLAENKVKEAIDETKKAAEVSPLEYGIKNLVLEKDAIKKDKWHQQAMRMYPLFESSMTTLFEELNKEIEEKK
ncbi:MAG TPA: hypothetical protein VF599_04785 [Pyrinomonadaceae bacterium]|jgi:tetratricopeptide (TPR) repeat protein